MSRNIFGTVSVLFIVLMMASTGFAQVKENSSPKTLNLKQGSHLVLLGGGLGSRMMEFGHFETELQLRFAANNLTIRNMCDEGDTPGYRPRSARRLPWAYEGAQKFRTLSDTKDKWGSSQYGYGKAESPDQWMSRLKTDVVIAFFGFNESFAGPQGLKAFKEELTGFVKHTLKAQYNAKSAPQLALVSPIAFENLSQQNDTPDGADKNSNLLLYSQAMKEVAEAHNVLFVDLFSVSQKWFSSHDENLTHGGTQLKNKGYQLLSSVLTKKLFGKGIFSSRHKALVHDAVMDKNWYWHNYYKIPNGVYTYGRLNGLYGGKNYPHELKKIAQMTLIRDKAIWAALRGEKMNVTTADKETYALPTVKTNYKKGDPKYLYGDEALNLLKVPKGYKIEMFASEKEFKELANPVQMSFDNKGRLWVATMPSYPHHKVGDIKPNDKLLILEDTDQDGKADKVIVFAENLHLPNSFEFGTGGVFVSHGGRGQLLFLKDTNGDDKADVREVVFSGFDTHDTHHTISGFSTDPSGAIYMGEGTFLHSHIETAYGPVRSTNGGFFRYDPRRQHLERSVRMAVPNPWGIAFDKWGQNFCADTSGPAVRWMSPGSVKAKFGAFTPVPRDMIEKKHRVRPTSGIEFISSRHFPDEVQGDLLINNVMGFLGTKQHKVEDDGTGYKLSHRQDLIVGHDGNFRPVDLEFAPDGSLYVIDWHNTLINHGHHNTRDPLRDHVHGRVFRITYPARPLVKPATIVGASIELLLENLKLPEYRSRYRTRRELRQRQRAAVLTATQKWQQSLDPQNKDYELFLLEALWVTWGQNRVDETLLIKLLSAKNYKVRAAAVKVLRYVGHQVKTQAELVFKAAQDEHSRVRLEALITASWLGKKKGLPILAEAAKRPLDSWSKPPYGAALAHLNGEVLKTPAKKVYKTHLTGADKKIFLKGVEVFRREGHCMTCHQPDGLGLPAAQFPPLAGSKWVMGNEERLIKLTLNGLLGPIKVKGVKYKAQMQACKMLSDEDIAAVLTFVRNGFGNKAPVISKEKVKQVRESTKELTGFYDPQELLKAHPNNLLSN
ncbi:MAG: HEAT repeat domain-containing protein [Lentisphaeraceae bacterium]|nr:HEAT repeat domain-containing protein [Lentisphaeraceae bacterium]